MHILIFCEQHPHTLGGAQMSTLLQAKFLERAGHTVTYVSPALRSGPVDDPQFIDLPSWSVPTVREYTWLWPADRHLQIVTDKLRHRPPVDIVHVQSDFWGAAFGYRFARENEKPVVHTMHHRLDIGVDGSIPFPGLFYAMLGRWQKWSLGDRFRRRPRNAFDYLAQYAAEADVVIAPSRHFARLLTSRGVATKTGALPTVIPTGVDDDVLHDVSRHQTATSGALQVAWVGRFSPEKRIIEFCQALSLVNSPITVTLVGDGVLRHKAKSVAPDFVTFTGALPYRDALGVIANADVLVQSSNNFETQGMTVSEAIALGTHVVIVDANIAEELPAGSFSVTRDLSAEALAEALDACANDIADLRRPGKESVRHEFRQSSRTAQMVDIYELTLDLGAPPRR
jgi:glycosyltransferase involved in cell wall biosynthesis